MLLQLLGEYDPEAHSSDVSEVIVKKLQYYGEDSASVNFSASKHDELGIVSAKFAFKTDVEPELLENMDSRHEHTKDFLQYLEFLVQDITSIKKIIAISSEDRFCHSHYTKAQIFSQHRIQVVRELFDIIVEDLDKCDNPHWEVTGNIDVDLLLKTYLFTGKATTIITTSNAIFLFNGAQYSIDELPLFYIDKHGNKDEPGGMVSFVLCEEGKELRLLISDDGIELTEV